MVERDIYEVANQLLGYVGPDTPEPLAKFLLREGEAASELADTITTLRARLETVEAETRERCAKAAKPTRPRPCKCNGCDCDKPEDAEDVGRWDGAYAAATTIRNLEPRHD